MDLKNTIDNTSKYKNDLKLARNKINAEIVSGGGTTANTLNEMPNAIRNLLNSKKKFAILDINSETIWNKRLIEINANYSLNFIPTQCIASIRVVNKNIPTQFMDIVVDSRRETLIREYYIEQELFKFNIKSFTETNIKIEAERWAQNSEKVILQNLIMIG